MIKKEQFRIIENILYLVLKGENNHLVSDVFRYSFNIPC